MFLTLKNEARKTDVEIRCVWDGAHVCRLRADEDKELGMERSGEILKQDRRVEADLGADRADGGSR